MRASREPRRKWDLRNPKQMREFLKEIVVHMPNETPQKIAFLQLEGELRVSVDRATDDDIRATLYAILEGCTTFH